MANNSNKGTNMALAGALAYVAMVLAIALLVVSAIVPSIAGVLGLVKDLALLIAVAIPAYYFTRGKAQWVKICYFIALVCFIVAALFGNHLF